MKKPYVGLIITFCVVFLFLGSNVNVFGASQVVKGTLLYIANDTSNIRVKLEDDRSLVIKPSPNVKIFRGQVGKEMRSVKLSEFALGDWITAVVDDNGTASSLKAYFGILKGTFSKLQSGKLLLKDGRSVRLHAEANVITANGKSGKISDLKKDDLLLCRINPVDNQAWTVLVVALADAATAPVKPPVSAKPVEKTSVPAAANIEKPKINSMKYSCSPPVNAGDKITVNMTGTPGGKASFEIKNLIALTPMSEVSPGSYQAVVTVPKDKTVVKAAVVGYLSVNNVKASPVQASALLTVGTQPSIAKVNMQPAAVPAQIQTDSKFIKVEEPITVAKSTPAAAQAKVVVTPVKNSETQKIVLTSPVNGSKIKRAFQVIGKAEPESTVLIEITYTNGQTGLLKLSGRVASQLVAVGKNGEFRMGPVQLDGPLATQGLEFTIKTYYADKKDHATVVVKVIGDRI